MSKHGPADEPAESIFDRAERDNRAAAELAKKTHDEVLDVLDFDFTKDAGKVFAELTEKRRQELANEAKSKAEDEARIHDTDLDDFSKGIVWKKP